MEIEQCSPNLRWRGYSTLPGYKTLQQLWQITTYNEDGQPIEWREEWRDLPVEYDD